ncbi:Crp/Fnr family transcriptional regulator [Vreelandella songnenensis]|uniref:Crp/Fnr family transcriptional regulator n=1 Tax=Vreelandella songnenensis TaxID=1176243 RepID=A0A2T0V6M9_9GAMM|nr:Crp/Fnr family transcriptional regulator [Halomonas songnenensis]PRY65767.1 Crp/Fnr family transcriptional regulator [Halomonas songnenensis]
MQKRHECRQNTLLGLLPEEELNRLLPNLEEVTLTPRQSLCEPGQLMEYAYFPLDAIVSLLGMINNGSSTETAVVGNTGVVGVSLFMSDESPTSRALVQRGGQALRIKGHLLKEEFFRAGPMQQLLLRYTQALLAQVAQTAICNRHHNLDQQLCRWLLLHIGRWPNNELAMTQELIANMLGVRREGITETACKLQKAGLISYYRGHIKIIDRQGLEERVCECYAMVEETYDRLLNPRQLI